MPEVPVELRKRYYNREGGYDTDLLIDSLDDRGLLRHMGVPQQYWSRALAIEEPMPPEIEQWITNLPYIFRPQFDKQDEQPELFGMGLALYGPTGAGKTTMAIALLKRVIRMMIANADPSAHARWYGAAMGRYVGWQDISRLYRKSIEDQDLSEELAVLEYSIRPGGEMEYRGDFLVLDDISRERGTDFNHNQLTGLLRTRREWGYPTILTCNTHPSEWQSVYGDVMGGFMDRSFLPVPMMDRITQ